MTIKQAATTAGKAPIRRPVLSLASILAVLAGSSAASAGTQCYDLDGPGVGTVYHVGDTVEAKHVTVNILEFQPNGQPSNHPNPTAAITQTDLAQGGAPALLINSVVVQVLPEQPVQEISLKYAENTGAVDQQKQNFGVNGDKLLQLTGGFEQLDGQELGHPKRGGPARVSVTAVPDSSTLPTWVRGTITVTALDQGVSGLALGASSQLVIDHVCMTN